MPSKVHWTIQQFLDGYPDQGDDTSLSINLLFYSDRLRCQPDNLKITEIHQQWFGRYKTLESKHGFIQWLFPIRDGQGMNYESQALQPHEITSMRSNTVILERIIKSYDMMLDFYGMRLVSAKMGLLDRSEDFSDRYKNLVYSGHNYLRISRILKCLSEFGLEHLNLGFLLHVLCEQSESNQLNKDRLRDSMDNYWANCIRDGQDRQWIGSIIEKVRLGSDGYVFTRAMYKDALEKRLKTDAPEN
ncbi:hypothetical protein L208DRAFT_1401682 [Tricholoma matsutake]|nr:hypothetical protein L208DRAFT_1401682 [Tricholoma matsutake 945]